jgi:hypothetical protein
VKINGNVKAVDGGSGYLNQMEPWAHFGGINKPFNLTVVFPDGNKIEIKTNQSRVKPKHPSLSE